MVRPQISVVMPVRDGERYIAQALDSIAAQGVPVETVVVDDGSSDGTAIIVSAHPLHPILIRQAPQGIATALNAGIAAASGALLAFLDHDDVWPAGRLRAMRTFLEANPECDGVYGRIVNTDAELRPIGKPEPVRMITAMLLRREVVARVGPIRTDLAHHGSVDWVSRALNAGVRLGFLDELVNLRRIHGGNMGITDRDGGRADLLRVLRDHHRRTRTH